VIPLIPSDSERFQVIPLILADSTMIPLIIADSTMIPLIIADSTMIPPTDSE
jgi:hypothetical protein